MTGSIRAQESLPEASVDRQGPLDGVTVIDLSWHLAGPFCTLILADLGARVIKVEAPGSHGGYDPGGFIRHWYRNQDAHYMALNRNKQSITLNLKSDDGKEIFKRLCARADVVFNNFRAGVMRRLGLGYEEVRAVNPQVIFASLSAFGQDGVYAQRPAVDVVVQALSGGMSMTGEPGRPPVRAGIPIADLAGGMWAVIGILTALRARDAGISSGCELDVSLLDGQIAMLPYVSARYFLDGTIPEPQGSGGSPTYRAFRCADDRYLVIAVIDQPGWVRLCGALGRDKLVDDLRFETAAARSSNAPTLSDLLEREFLLRSVTEWADRLGRADVPYGRVRRLDEVLHDPQLLSRGMVVEIEHTLGDRLKFVGNPIRIPGSEPRLESPPCIGEHTDEVLGGLGVSGEYLSALRSRGVL